MIQCVMAGKRGLDIDIQAVLDGSLADVLLQRVRAERLFRTAVFRQIGAVHQPVFRETVFRKKVIHTRLLS